MPLLLGQVEEKEAWIRVLENWDGNDKRDVLDNLRHVERLTKPIIIRLLAGRNDVVKRLIDTLGVWFPVAYYRALPVIYPYIVRDPTCRQNRYGRPEEYCSPNHDGFMRADNTPIKQLVEGRRVMSPFVWYRGRMRRGFVASHAWREPENYEQDHVLASRDPWLNSFVPNLCWLPSALSKLTDDEGSFAQHYLQVVARSTYGNVHFENEQMQEFVSRLWDRLPQPMEMVGVEVPDLEHRGQFQMRDNDVSDRISDLRTVVFGLRDALNNEVPDRGVVHHRYTLRNLRRNVHPQRLTELHHDLSNYLTMLIGGEGHVELRQDYQDTHEGVRMAVRTNGRDDAQERVAVEIVLNPADPTEFKKLLSQTHLALRTRVFADGRVPRVDQWRANSFTANSNLMGNIKSSGAYRNAVRDGVVRLEFAIANN